MTIDGGLNFLFQTICNYVTMHEETTTYSCSLPHIHSFIHWYTHTLGYICTPTHFNNVKQQQKQTNKTKNLTNTHKQNVRKKKHPKKTPIPQAFHCYCHWHAMPYHAILILFLLLYICFLTILSLLLSPLLLVQTHSTHTYSHTNSQYYAHRTIWTNKAKKKQVRIEILQQQRLIGLRGKESTYTPCTRHMQMTNNNAKTKRREKKQQQTSKLTNTTALAAYIFSSPHSLAHSQKCKHK